MGIVALLIILVIVVPFGLSGIFQETRKSMLAQRQARAAREAAQKMRDDLTKSRRWG